MPVSEADKLFLCCRKFLVATPVSNYDYFHYWTRIPLHQVFEIS